jgi:putative SOS response-associated peptidase YedK
MCGRMTLTTSSIADVVDELLAEISPGDTELYRPRFNVAPSDLHWIVERQGGNRLLVPAVWGFGGSRRALINVRGETLASGTAFREAFRASRCVVVSDGFLEWSAEKTPFWYHRADGGLVLMAGLYQRVRDTCAVPSSHSPPSPSVASPSRPRFTVITTRPNGLVSQVHDRMPVVLPRDRIDDWLTGEPTDAVTRLLAPADEDLLVATPLSRRVNSVKHDDPACLAPSLDDGARDQKVKGRSSSRQTSLF